MADLTYEQKLAMLAAQEQENQQNAGGQATQTITQQLGGTQQVQQLQQQVAADQAAKAEQQQAQQKAVSTTAEYTGQSSALGGTWGKTPQTLAQESFAGGQIKYTVQTAGGGTREATADEARQLTQQAVNNMSAQQREQYKAALAQLESAPGATAEEKLSYVQQQNSEAARALPVSARTIENLNTEISRLTSQQGDSHQPVNSSVVRLDNGEYIDRKAFDSLDSNYQDKLMKSGITGLERYIKEQEPAEKAAKVNQELDRIKSKQENFEKQSLWDKVMITLNTPITFDELIQETLTLGSAKTAAFDTDAIDKEFFTAKAEALKRGIDAGLPDTPDDYRMQVLSKQQTAQELGMQLVPFEYARPGRWDELQLWEKIVYPVVDVVSLVPVVGWIGKAVSAGAKGVSIAAKISSLGGKAAVQFAAKDAALAVEKAATQKLVKEGLLAATKEAAKNATDSTLKKILQGAIKPAAKDAEMAAREFNQISKNAAELAKLEAAAGKIEPGTAVKVVKASERVETAVGKAGKFTEPVDAIGSAGIVGYSTVANWGDLTPEQRAAGLGLAVLTSGIGGKAVNVAENIIDPYKIPIAALKPRAQRSRAVAGKIYNPGKGGLKGTDRLLMDHTIDPENARMAVADVMKQLAEGKKEAKSTIKTVAGEKEIKVKGTGLQATVGRTAISASPMGEIFKEGTGASGAKSNLEKYLQQANAKAGTKIEIESRPLKIGETELEVKTISAPGLTVKGSEGGMYFGAGLYNQFSHQAAAGGKGKIASAALVAHGGITELPKELKKIDIDKRYEAALKYFDGTKHVNELTEGFKRWQSNMELENLVTNSSQLQRTQNLRSKLADTLHANRGEYYTRDPKGRIELFNMYMEGGRTTPYTLKELYQLKGNALRNSLEDMFFGLEKKIDDLKEGKIVSTKENIVTKEEQLSKAFNDIDTTVQAKGMTEAEAKRLKQEIIDQYRSRIEYVPNRQVLRKRIAELAGRSEVQRRRDTDQERAYADRIRAEREQVRRDIINGRTPVREGREEPKRPIREDRQEAVRQTPADRQQERQERNEPVRSRESDRPETVQRTETPRQEGRSQERTKPETRPEVRTDTRTRTTPEMRYKIKRTPDLRQPIEISFASGEIKRLDRKQLEGAVGWKQGLFYRLHYPPFGPEDKLVTREAIPGIQYHDGIGSAAKSMTALYGEIPRHVKLDMGIVDIDIFRTRDPKKPQLAFKPDPKQKTDYGKGREKIR